MKRVLALTLCVLMLVATCGCDERAAHETENESEITSGAADSTMGSELDQDMGGETTESSPDDTAGGSSVNTTEGSSESTTEPSGVAGGAPSTEERFSVNFSSYEGVLKTYAEIVRLTFEDHTFIVGADPRFDTSSESDLEWLDDLSGSVYLLSPLSGNDNTGDYKSLYGYALKDLNGDGSDELILMRENYHLIAIFSLSEGKPVLLQNFWERCYGAIGADGELYIGGSSGAGLFSHSIYEIVPNGMELALLWEIGGEGLDDNLDTICYKREGGKRVQISREEHEALLGEYPPVYEGMTYSEYTKENAGLTFTSIFPQTAEGKIPVDFASYESIITMWRQIAKNTHDYYEKKAEYDAMFYFPDEASITMYDELCRVAIKYYPAQGKSGRNDIGYAYFYGYDWKDLNRDGRLELILLTENYNVLAIFSISAHTGKLVLLECFLGNMQASIDASGLIFVSDSVGSVAALCRTHTIYTVAEDGETLVFMEMLYQQGKPEGHVDADGKHTELTWEQYQSMSRENPFRSADEAAAYTRTASGLMFQAVIEYYPWYTDRVIDMYHSAMNNLIKVYDTEKKQYLYLGNCRWSYSGGLLSESETLEFTIVDLDGDRLVEAVVGKGDKIVLWYDRGQIYMCSYTFRQMDRIMTDGSYTCNDMTSRGLEYGRERLSFTEGGTIPTETVLYHIVEEYSGTTVYYIGGNDVCEKMLNAYLETVCTEEVTWETFTVLYDPPPHVYDDGK